MKSVMKSAMWMIMLAFVMGCSTDNILSYDDQLKKDTTIIDKYLAKNGIEATIDTLSGLRLVVTDAGAGLFPTLESKLTAKYKGSFLSGGVFADPGAPQTFNIPLSQMIPAWQIAFGKYVAKGGKATLYIPSGLAYGRAGAQGIPGNSNLVFEVELIGYTN